MRAGARFSARLGRKYETLAAIARVKRQRRRGCGRTELHSSREPRSQRSVLRLSVELSEHQPAARVGCDARFRSGDRRGHRHRRTARASRSAGPVDRRLRLHPRSRPRARRRRHRSGSERQRRPRLRRLEHFSRHARGRHDRCQQRQRRRRGRHRVAGARHAVRALGVDGGTTYDVDSSASATPRGFPTIRTPFRRVAPTSSISVSARASRLKSEQNTIDQVRNAGVIVIAAAGNEASSNPSFPAAYTGVVSVAATTITRTRASYSNFGPTIDVAAPGGNSATDVNGDGIGDGVVSTIGDDTHGAVDVRLRGIDRNVDGNTARRRCRGVDEIGLSGAHAGAVRRRAGGRSDSPTTSASPDATISSATV